MSSENRRKVLIAIDGSEHSKEAFYWYVNNVHRTGDMAIMAWNIDPHAANFGTVNLMTGDPDVISKIVHEQQIHVEHQKTVFQEMMDANKIEGRVLLLFEKQTGEAIIETADAERADMIIVGSRGLGTIRRTILGSVSDYVLHHAHVPVFICKTDGRPS